MTTYLLIAELIGLLGSIFLIYSSMKKNDSDLIVWQGIANVLWIAYYGMFGMYVGMIATCFSVARNAFVFKWKSRKAKNGFMLTFFLFSIGQFIFIENLIHSVPIIALFVISWGVIYKEKHKLTAYIAAGNALLLFFFVGTGMMSGVLHGVAILLMLAYRTLKITKSEQDC